MLESLWEKTTKIEDIQEQLEEMRTAKAKLDEEIPN
jgi:predicted nuclease with TOPRIM domain